MGLKIETWNIAYRRKTENTYMDTDSPFTLISNGYKGWYADPFLFDFQDDTYLFAEYYSYRLQKGIIAIARFDSRKDCFEKFVPIIVEDYHLSYPVVFRYQDRIIMMPECSESENLFFYEAVEFPFKWKKRSVLDRKTKLVDSTPFLYQNDLYCFSLEQGGTASAENELVLMRYDGCVFRVIKSITSDMSVARPGGNVIKGKEDSLIRVSQNCEEQYGKALNFLIVRDFLSDYKEERTTVWTPDIISVAHGDSFCGIHTYNSSRFFEVIDLKRYRNSYYRLYAKFRKH